MVDEVIREALEEIEARGRIKAAMPDIFAGAFRQQVEFVLDPSKFKALFCTRRSAKSYTAGIYLVSEALKNPGCNCLFIGLTRASAKAIIWKDILRVLNTQFSLGAEFNQTDLTMSLPNGSVISVTGVDADHDEMNKLLGRKYRLVCIDEASMYTIDVRNLVYGVLGPAMTDPNAGGQRGTICLMGTASDFPSGLFYDVTTRKERGWKIFEWTAHDNPYVAKQWQEALDEIARERPLYMETPQFKQWYLNQWVIDEEKLVYRFNTQRNLTKTIPLLPEDGWTYILGVDTGWEDDNAFVLTAFHVNDPNLYVLKVYKKKKLTFDQVVEVILQFMKDPVYAPHKVFIDGANKQGVESMRARSAIPFEYADKQDKATFIELCNADLVQGKILVHDTSSNRELWQEMAALVWVTDGGKIKLPKKEHPNLANHLCDAFLYSWRNGYHYHSGPVEKKLVHGSREWYLQQSENIWEREREKMMEEAQQDLWPEQPPMNLLDIFKRY
jgi:phage terminase large subunit